MYRTILLALLLLAIPNPANGRPVDAELRRVLAAEHIPSASVAVVRHGRIVYLGAFGFGNLEFKAPATTATRYEIASMSKMFTGAAIRILADEGRLSLEDPVSKYLDHVPDNWKPMRLRHLVAMTSGLPEDWDLIGYPHSVLDEYTDESMIETFYKLPLVAPVGREHNYCGPGYAVLGIVVERVTGEPLAKFVAERIFRPAGMTETTYNDPSAVVAERADGYRIDDGQYRRGFYVAPYMHSRADVGMLSTARDLARWSIALDRGVILQEPSRLWTEFDSDDGKPTGYGYGWAIGVSGGHVTESHSGGFRTGFTSLITRYPDDDTTIVVLTNSSGARVDQLTAILANAFGVRTVDPWTLKPSPDRDPKETEAIRAAVGALTRGQSSSIVMPGATAGLEAIFREDSASLSAMKFLSRVDLHGASTAFRGATIARVVYFTVETPDGRHILGVNLTRDGRILAFEAL